MNPDSVEPVADLTQVFEHPQGLVTARAITKSLIIMGQKLAQTGPSTTEPQTTPSSLTLDSRPMPDIDSISATMLNTILTFDDSHLMPEGERVSQPSIQDQDHEMPDKSHVELSPSTTAPLLGLHSDPFSNAGDGHRSVPHDGPYLSTPPQPRPNDDSHMRPQTDARASSSLFPNALPSSNPPQPLQFISSNMWVNQQYPAPTPPNHPQHGISIPRPGPLELRHSTYSSVACQTMGSSPGKATKKRKFVSGEEKKPKAPKLSKPKEDKKESVFDDSIYMRILEFTPPSFLGKARLISKPFKDYVDQFTSIYVNLRKENFGSDMPAPPDGISEQQYNDLLGGKKGCLNPGCTDKKAIRTHWSWYKRWCWNCWKGKIEREDRVLKTRGVSYGRATLLKMLECIPVGMHDSFMKPHDYIENIETRARGAPRLYKYYLTEDIDRINKEFHSLTPKPYIENSEHTPAERVAAQAAHQELMDGLEEKRAAFFAERKAKNDEHMAQVQKIEAGIRMRRARNRNPYDECRNARKELFSRRAREDLPHIDHSFIERTTAYKAATRIFRNPGTERGWQTLKPKIIAEWEVFRAGKDIDGASRMDVTDATDGNGALPSHLRSTNDGGRHSHDPFARLQQYQSQLQRLGGNKQTHGSLPPHDPSGSPQGSYTHGAHSSQSSYPPVGSSSTFPVSVFNTSSGLGNGNASSNGGQRPQSFATGDPQVPPQYVSTFTSSDSNSGYSQDNLYSPNTQISINSLLGP